MSALALRRVRAIVATLALLAVSATASAESVRVTVAQATLWANPTGTGVVGIVRRGEVLEVDSREGRWVLVVFPADPRRKGYILEQQVESVPDGARAPRAGQNTRTTAAQRPPARPRQPRRPSFLYIGVTGQAAPLDFTITETTTTLLETETRTTEYTPSRLPGFEFTFGQEVSRKMMITGGVVRMAGTGSASATAQIPHPILYNTPRTLEARTDSVRAETALHLRLDFRLYRSPAVQVTAGAGPSVFFVRQEFIDRLSYQEDYPYDTVTLVEAATKSQKTNSFGGHAEIDVTGRLSRQVGWQGTVRYAYARPTFDLSGSTPKTNAGGAQVGGGLRFVF